MFTRSPPPLHNTNDCVATRNYCVGIFLCKNYTEPLCKLIHLKTQPETNFKSPMFTRVPPPFKTHTTAVW